MEKKYIDYLNKEWIITNGIGGYASSTYLGCNTSKYHGLLVATINYPTQRQLILSKLDESIEIGQNKYNIFIDMGKDNDTEECQYLKSFEYTDYPVYKYEVQNIQIEKSIIMKRYENTICIKYKIKNDKENIKLNLEPIVNFRDFHKRQKINLDLKQAQIGKIVKLKINNNITMPVYMYCSDGKYVEYNNELFKNMFYRKENISENNIMPGVFTIKINALEEKEIEFICSLKDNIELLDVNGIFEEQKNRMDQEQRKISKYIQLDSNLLREYVVLKDKLTIRKPKEVEEVLILGYPYFLEDGRNLSISIEGLCLLSKDYELAKKSLLSIFRSSKKGIVPNGYSGFDDRAIYNNIEVSLMLFRAVYKLYKYSKDIDFIKKVYSKLEQTINNYCSGTQVEENNVYMNKDYLLVSESNETYEKFEKNQFEFFYRKDKIKFELNCLWYNSLMIMSEFANIIKDKEESLKYLQIAQKVKENILRKFCDGNGNIKLEKNENCIKQLLAYSLEYPIYPKQDRILIVAEDIEDRYKETLIYQYPYTLGAYYDTLKNLIKYDTNKEEKSILKGKLMKFINKIKEFIEKNGIIAEEKFLEDNKGAIIFASNVAEIFRILIENNKEVK